MEFNAHVPRQIAHPFLSSAVQRDQSEDTLGDTFSDLLAGADDDIRDKYQKEAELIDDDFLLNQLADTEKECDEDTQRQGEQEEDDVYVTKVCNG